MLSVSVEPVLGQKNVLLILKWRVAEASLQKQEKFNGIPDPEKEKIRTVFNQIFCTQQPKKKATTFDGKKTVPNHLSPLKNQEQYYELIDRFEETERWHLSTSLSIDESLLFINALGMAEDMKGVRFDRIEAERQILHIAKQQLGHVFEGIATAENSVLSLGQQQEQKLTSSSHPGTVPTKQGR